MALKGDLASVDLAQVFQMLAMNQKLGLLLIQAPRSWRALYFDPRGVTLYYNEHTLLDKTLRVMTASGQLAGAAVSDARHQAATLGQSLTDTLLASGHLGEPRLREEFRAAMEEEIYELFFWGNARFEFFEGATQLEGYDGKIDDSFFFSTDGLIMEAARRIDEWSFIVDRVPSPLEVFRSLPVDQSQVGDDNMEILQLVDGRNSVARIVELSGRPNFYVHKCLAGLVDQGYVEPVPPGELLATAEHCMRERRLPEAINLFERALAAGQGGTTAHHRVAEAYRLAQEYELAVYHLTCEAEQHAANGQTGAAAALFLQASRILGTHLAARTRLVELTVGSREVSLPDFEPLAEGKALVDLLLEVGEIEQVRRLLEDLLRNHPSDLGLKKSLVSVHTKAGDMRRVVELYESIAADLVHDDPIEAVKYLQKILILDRSRKDISERIRTLYEMDERRRSRRRNLVTLAAAGLLLLGGAAAWLAYDRHAGARFHQLDVRSMLERKDFTAAADIYRAFVASYPFTLAGRDAEAELVRIQGLQAAHAAEAEARAIQRQRDAERRRVQYRADWNRYRAAFDAGDLDAALQAIELVRKSVATSQEPVDQEWAAGVGLENIYVQLYDYLAKAAALERSARDKVRAGDWQGARKDLLELTHTYAMAPCARGVRLPYQLESRPPGAAIWRDGSPLTITRDGETVPVTTPAILECGRETADEFELRLPGFEPRTVRVTPVPDETTLVVLTAIPDWRFHHEVPAITGAGVGAGYLGVGLRGGKVAIAWTRDSKQASMVIELPELSEIRGLPVFTSTRVLFRTNDGQLACHLLEDGGRAWQVTPPQPLATDPVVQDGRVFFGDTAGALTCMTVETGRVLWTQQLDGPLSAPPTVSARTVRVGTREGTLLRIDAADGRLLGEPWRYQYGITTGVHLLGKDTLVFGTGGGDVVVRGEDGTVRWMKALGATLRPDELTVAGDCVLVAGGDVLRRLAGADGAELARSALGGTRRCGPVVAGGQVFVGIHDPKLPRGRAEILRVLTLEELAMRWEYRDEKGFVGDLAADGSGVYVTTSSGEVLRFK